MKDRLKFVHDRLTVALERLLGGPWRALSTHLARVWDPPVAPLAPQGAPDEKGPRRP